MEAGQRNGDNPPDDELVCWLTSPTLEEFKNQVNDALVTLASNNSDPDAKHRY